MPVFGHNHGRRSNLPQEAADLSHTKNRIPPTDKRIATVGNTAFCSLGAAVEAPPSDANFQQSLDIRLQEIVRAREHRGEALGSI